MIKQATYTDGTRTATIALERIDTWLEADETVINFPGVVALDGDRFFMTIHWSRHGDEGRLGVEPYRAYLSDDAGATWTEAPRDFPMLSRDARSGWMNENWDSGAWGHLRDGSIARIDHNTQIHHERGHDLADGHMHERFQQHDPTFRWHRFASDGSRLEHWTFKVPGLPWGRASYQCYSSILELDGGDLLTALEWVDLLPDSEQWQDSRGAPRPFRFGTFIVRSSDRGKTWEYVTKFDPAEVKLMYGIFDQPVEEGLDEADLAVLPNGDILCVMRADSYAPMWQARSTDGGHSWTKPESTGWQGVKPRLEVLPNGVLACAAGRGGYGHPQVTHVMLSLDGTGQHWEQPFYFHTGPGCSYTPTMQRDGKLHVMYSHSDFTREMGTHGLPNQKIRRAVFDVQLSGG